MLGKLNIKRPSYEPPAASAGTCHIFKVQYQESTVI